MASRIPAPAKTLIGIATVSALMAFLGGCATPPQNSSAGGQPSGSGQLATDSPTDPNGTEITPALNVDSQGRALRGYDVVAYFKNQQAVPGEATWLVSWQGVDWYFSNAENKAQFEANPDKYAPENGGYCTFGVVISKKFDIDPTVWLLHDKELYVFLSEEVKEKFLQDTVGNLNRVRSNWPSIKDKQPEEL